MRRPHLLPTLLLVLAFAGVAPRSASWPVLGAAPLAAQSSLVPVQHPVYDWLHRQRVEGRIPAYRSEFRPMTRAQVHGFLVELDGNADLGAFDRTWLRTLLAEFGTPDAETSVTAIPADSNVGGDGRFADRVRRIFTSGLEKHVWATTDEERTLVLDAWGSIGRTSGEDENGSFANLRDEKGIRMWGDILNHFGFHLEAGNLSSQSGRQAVLYDPLYNKTFESVVQEKGNALYVEASATARWGPAALHIGRGGLQVGTGGAESLTLSRDASTFDWIRLDLDFDRVVYSALHGSLASDVEFGRIVFPGDTVLTNYAKERWLALHRFDFRLTDRVRFGFGEMITYSARPTDYAYLNPVAPLFFSELDSGDRDNAVWILDGTVRPIDRIEVSGTVFIDDINSIKQIFSSDAKENVDRAFDFGVDAALPYGVHAGVRWVRIEPWVYTHWQRLNALEQRGFPLGHPLGPNAESRSATLEAWLPYRTRLALSVSQSKKGLNPIDANGNVIDNAGGDVTLGANGPEPIILDLFENADVHEFRTFSFEAATEPARAIRFSLRYERREATVGTRIPDRNLLHFGVRYGM